MSRAAVDMSGTRVGRLLVLEKHGTNSDGRVTWLCACDCGSMPIVSGKHMRAGEIKSCGCLKKDTAANNFKARRDDNALPF